MNIYRNLGGHLSNKKKLMCIMAYCLGGGDWNPWGGGANAPLCPPGLNPGIPLDGVHNL